MRRIKPMSVFLLVFVVGVGCSAADLSSSRLSVQSATEDPVKLSSLGVPETEKSGEAPFRLTFRVENLSDEHLRLIEFEAMTYSASGQVVGLHGFTMKTNLKPGEEQLFHYKTGEQNLMSGDTVQLRVASVWGFRRNWDLDALRAAGKLLAEPLAAGVLKAGPADPCETKCATKEAACDAKCTCGTQTFGCSCSTTSFSYTCTCFRCV